jgi:hypothetical protein
MSVRINHSEENRLRLSSFILIQSDPVASLPECFKEERHYFFKGERVVLMGTVH